LKDGKFDGSSFIGKFTGKGQIIYEDNSVYQGDIVNGLHHGKGTRKCGVCHGSGKCGYCDGRGKV